MPVSPAHGALKTFVVILALVGAVGSAQTFKLAKIDATGLKRLTNADVARLSGLRIDQSLATADLDAAASKLAGTGFFTDVKYRYATAGQTMSVTFDLQEAVWNIRVVYDNFVWFSDDELNQAVRETIPSFDGTAPQAGSALDLVSAALAQALAKRSRPGRVDYKPWFDLATGDRAHIFAVADPAVKLCALHVSGTASLPEADLLKTASSLIGVDYSRNRLVDFARKTMTQPYRRQGYWRATYGPPAVTTGGTPGCDGVTAVLRVDEGVSYAWDHAEWSGNVALSSAALDTLLGLKPGDVADASRVDAGVRAIDLAHGKLGYLAEKSAFVPSFDDAARRATFKFSISEGPQYHMGTVTIVGLADKDQQALVKKWKLQPGDVYDASYIDEFVRDQMRAYFAPPHTVTRELSAAPNTTVIDVKLVVK